MSRTLSCVLVGQNALLATCAEQWLERGHRVAGVVSPNPQLREWACARQVPTADFGPDLMPLLTAAPFDYLFSVANLRILPERVLELPRELPINFHDALLPRHAGVHATAWAIMEGERRHGVTWHVMTAEADAGDVLVQREVPVAADETSYTLNTKCYAAGTESFGELAAALEDGTVTRRPQDAAARTHHGRFDRPAGGGVVSWLRGADELDALVRATDFGPQPNEFGVAKVLLDDGVVLLRKTAPVPTSSGATPGTVVHLGEDGATVATAAGDLRLVRISDVHGDPRTPAELGWRTGDRLPEPDPALLARIQRAPGKDEPYWVRRLRHSVPLELAGGVAPTGGHRGFDLPAPDGLSEHGLCAAGMAFLARATGQPEFDIDLHRDRAEDADRWPPQVCAPAVPVRITAAESGDSLAGFTGEVRQRLESVARRGTYLRDVHARYPDLPRAALPVAVEFAEDLTGPVTAGNALVLRIQRGGGRWRWEFAAGVVPPETAELLAEHAAAFVRAAAGPAGIDLTATPMCSDEHRRRVLVEWNATGADYPRDAAVHQLVAERAGRCPDEPAVVCGAESLTYRELDRRSSALAGHLLSRGAGPGRIAGIYLRRSTDLVVALLGVLKSGAAYVPLDPVYPPERIAHMLADAEVRLVVTESAIAADLPGGTEAVEVDRAHEEIAAAAPCAGGSVRGDELAYVIYTSGSTGVPKGVRIPHRALLNLLCSVLRYPGVGERDRMLAVTTVCFDIAALELFAPLLAGGCVEVAPEPVVADGFELVAALERTRPTLVQATPSTWRMLVDAGWSGTRGLTALCGGEALPRDLAGELLRRADRVYNLYGPTETTIWSAVAELTADQPVTIGRPLANTRCYVLDESMRPVPPGLPGELHIGGDGVAAGYLNRAELTAARFPLDPFDPLAGRLYRTGDRVRHRADGRLEFLERADDQVKLHGYRIELGEVAALLREHPSVSDAIVVLREDVPGDRRLVGYVTGSGAGPAVLRDHLRVRLPDYMVPAAFVELERLPATANGKVDRDALPRPAAVARSAPPVAADGTEQRIAAAWREVLGVDEVGAQDNFFEAGGNSLQLMRVLARLRESVHPELSRVEMFRYPTIRSMAEHLADHTRPEPSTSDEQVEVRTAGAGAGGRRAALAALRRKRTGRRSEIGARGGGSAE